MGSMIRQCSWILTRFQVKVDGRTAYTNLRGKEYEKQLVQFGRRLFVATSWCGMVWYGLIECAVHVHRQVVSSRQLTLLQCEPQLSCSAWPGKRNLPCRRAPIRGRKKKALATEHNYAPAADNCSCLRCKHAACDVRSSSKCTSHNVNNSSVDDRAPGSRRARSGTTATEQPCCCGTCSPPETRRCGGTLPPRVATTCWSAVAARHQRSPPR